MFVQIFKFGAQNHSFCNGSDGVNIDFLDFHAFIAIYFCHNFFQVNQVAPQTDLEMDTDRPTGRSR